MTGLWHGLDAWVQVAVLIVGAGAVRYGKPATRLRKLAVRVAGNRG